MTNPLDRGEQICHVGQDTAGPRCARRRLTGERERINRRRQSTRLSALGETRIGT
ncbi:hypothetical protein [Burkholderia sp. Bp8963]|uniref:hypothetical protein n=1 Tax=Burkholderia sp. Bp8963 TaxID=2184547 RepID=UPI001639E0CE|nr:hypothetical protein [Burkholderia sp. Bp8963]